SSPDPTRSRSSGRSSTRSSRSGSATGPRSRTTRRVRGARPPPTIFSTGTAGRGVATEQRADRGLVDGRGRHDRRDRARAGAAALRDGGLRRAAEPAYLGDDAHRVGAAGVEVGGRGDARRDGGAAPVADAAAGSEAERGE